MLQVRWKANYSVAATVRSVGDRRSEPALTCGDLHSRRAGRVDGEVKHDGPIGMHESCDHKSVHVKFFGNLWPVMAKLLRRRVVDELVDDQSRGDSANCSPDNRPIVGTVRGSAAVDICGMPPFRRRLLRRGGIKWIGNQSLEVAGA